MKLEIELNVRQTQLHRTAVELSKSYRKTEADLIDVLQQCEAAKVHLALGFPSLFVYATECLKLSEACAYMMISIARKSREVPELKKAIRTGELTVAKAHRIVSVLEPENKTEMIQKAVTLPKRELEKEVVRLQPMKAVREMARPIAENRNKLQIGISDELLKKLERAKTVVTDKKRRVITLEETIAEAIQDYLKHHDPIEKAKRSKHRSKPPHQSPSEESRAHPRVSEAGFPPSVLSVRGKTEVLDSATTRASSSSQLNHSARAELSRSARMAIPAQIKHAIHLRDRGKCAFRDPSGKQLCGGEAFVELHHRVPVARGGANTFENLVTLCHSHHSFWHEHQHQHEHRRQQQE